MFRKLEIEFSFFDCVTVHRFDNIKVAYVIAEDVRHLKTVAFDYVFVLFPHNASSIAIDWSKIKFDRRRVMRRKVHNIRSYIDGNNFIPIDSTNASTEILEFQTPNGTLKVMVPTVADRCFIPRYLSGMPVDLCKQGNSPVLHLMGINFPPRQREGEQAKQASLKI